MLQFNPDGQAVPGSRVGVESIKQCITALENYRFNHCGSDPDYLADSASQASLRHDVRIKTFEMNAQVKEPERLAESQILKAAGPVSGRLFSPSMIVPCF